MRKILSYIVLLNLAFLWSCGEDDEDLPSVEERTSKAVNELREQLIAPDNGWRLDYHPIDASGTFFMILDFDEDGTVNIQTDVAADDGEYFDHTIPYRIDAALGIELVFETYGVFHYLFELQQASFGGEFEFIFQGEDDGNLIFESKSDFIDPTEITMVPANTSDLNAFSREIAANFEEFAGQSPRLFGGVPPSQQLYFANSDISIFWSVDLTSRTILADVAGQGSSISEISNNGSLTSINHFTGYAFQNGTLQLEDPISTEVNGTSITIESVTLEDFSMTGTTLCDTVPEATPVYSGSVAGQGPVTITKSLYNSSGTGFTEQSDSFYAVNVLFVLNEDFQSLSEDGSIAEYFPGAVGFMMTYGFENDSIPAYSVGLLVEDEDDNIQLYLREIQPTTTEGNKVTINLTDDYYFSATPTPEEEQGMQEMTDEVFFGSTLYAYDLGIEGLTAYLMYNPCNNYELVLVQ